MSKMQEGSPPPPCIEKIKGQAKTYQVKQVLKAIERLELEHGTEK